MTDPLASLKKRTHQDLVREVLRACNMIPGVYLFPVGVTRVKGRKATVGMTGTPDLLGWKARRVERWVTPPIPIAFEVKVGKDRLRREQAAFLARAKHDGVICGEIRSVEQAIKLLINGG